MATLIISGSRGTDDPTMATLPFMAAKVAKEQGHEVVLWLWNESVTLGRKGTADHVTGVNLTPLKDLLAAVQAANIPIWVCGACAVARQIGAGDLVAGATIKGMPDYIKAVAERLSDIKRQHGPEAIAGLSSARCTNEENYLFQKFLRAAVGTNNVDHCARY